jgi:hypothetical protein
MKAINNFHLIILIIICNVSTILSQSLNFGWGPIFTRTKAVVAVKNGGEDFSNTGYTWNVSYEHFLKNKKLSITANYTQFESCTLMLLEIGGYQDGGGNNISGAGYCGGAKIQRLDLLLNYNVINNKRRFYLKPHVGVGIQKSNAYEDVGIYSTLNPFNGPFYFETEPISSAQYSTLQLTPTAGIKIGWLLWKHFDIGLTYQGVLGFKPYQKMFLKYNYKGEIQPDAEYSANGTGIFFSLGIGYRFAKLIKD